MNELRPVQVSGPDELPVSIADAKAQLRVFHEDDDDHIGTLINSAVEHLDGYAGVLGRCIVNQEWRQDFRDWDWRFRLPFPNVSAATITYRDAGNTEQTVTSDQFEIVEASRGAEIVFKDTFQEPSTFDDVVAPISVTFTAGYGAAAAVPHDIKVAIMFMVQMDYDQPEPQKAQATQMAINAKIEKHRWVTV